VDLPNARIFTYGYDVDVTDFLSQASQSRIHDHAQTLLGRLAQRRDQTETASLHIIVQHWLVLIIATEHSSIVLCRT